MEYATGFIDAFILLVGGALIIGGFILGRIVKKLTN